MTRRPLALTGLAFALLWPILVPRLSAQSPQGLADDGRRAELEAAIAAAVDERGVPTPQQFALRVELARLYLGCSHDDCGEKPVGNDDCGEPDAAAEHLRVAAELGPLDPDLSLWLARREFADGRSAAAGHHLRTVVEQAESSEAALLLAEIYRQRGRHKVALEHARQAAAYAAADDELVQALDLVLQQAEAVGSYGEAVDAAQRLMEVQPDDWRHPWHLARILAAQGKSQEAVEVLGRSVELADARGEDAWPARRDLGISLVAEDRYEEAREPLESFLAFDSSDADAHAAMAQVEERLGDAAAAGARARRVLDEVPDHAGALLVLGRIHAASGDFEAARSALESAVAGDPESKRAHYQLSLACARLRDRVCAERHLARYQELQHAAEDVVEMTRMGGGDDGR